MYFLYLATSIAELIVARKIYRKIVNPVVLYVLPWLLSVSLYEMKLIKYYTLSLTTWLIIILFQGLFFACCFVFKEKKEAKVRDYCHSLDSRTVFWTIMALTAFSALAIMPNFIFFLHRYGITFMSKFSEVYNDRLNGNAPFSIPYIGVFIYLCVVLTGIYYKKYGFNFYLFIPLGLAVIDSIQGGGRSGLVLIFLLFVVPYLFVQKDTKKVKKNKNWIWIAAFLFLVVAVFVLVTRERSWIDENHPDYQYMSDTMKSLIKISPSIYKNYAYFSSPIGVLNAYLENPDFTFGKNSLSFFISFLNKFGADLPYARYQDYYYVPIHTNVGTYIREIIQDYYYFAPLVLIAFTLLFSKAYALLRRGNPFGEILFSIMGVSVVMSFFVCYYRESVFWIMLIEIPMFHYIYRLIRKKIHGASFLSAEPGDGAGPAEEAPPAGDAVDVSVVFVNYFTCDLTCQAIASVRERSRGFTYEIIVVDNSCDGAEFARLTERLQGLATVIDAKGNLGFGRANNLAATKAKGKYLFFLNTDTLLLNNAIFELYAFLEQNPRAGVAGGNLYNAEAVPNHSFEKDEKNLANERKQGSLLTAFSHHFIRRRDFNYSDRPMKIDGYVCGADLLIRSDVFRTLHGFDDDIFMYAEEALLCRRVIFEAGYEIYSVPSAGIVHLEGKSFKGVSERKIRAKADGNFIYYEKSFGHDAAMEYLDIHVDVFQKKMRRYFFLKNRAKSYETAVKVLCAKRDEERRATVPASEEEGS